MTTTVCPSSSGSCWGMEAMVAVLMFPPIGTLELLSLEEMKFIALIMLADPALEV